MLPKSKSCTEYAHSSGGTFDWNSYLTEINSIKAPKALFNQVFYEKNQKSLNLVNLNNKF